GAVLGLRAPQSTVTGQTPPPGATDPTVLVPLNINLAGVNMQAHPIGVDLLPGVSNELIGNDRSKWATGLPTYSEVHYQDAYQGIDVVYHGHQGSLQYDFLVTPNADASQIRLDFGSARPTLLADGSLSLALPGGPVTQAAPVLYQDGPTGRTA